MKKPILPDVLKENLDVVFCGMAAGKDSARTGYYYADENNRFWPTLHDVGLTDQQIRPDKFQSVLDYGIGLTDLCKFHFGPDRRLPPDAPDVPGLIAKIKQYAPKVIAFNGKKATRLVAEKLQWNLAVDYGPLGKSIGTSEVWVLTQTSRKNEYWKLAPWSELARYLKQKLA